MQGEFETLYQMKKRHLEERRRLIQALSDADKTQKEAARLLGISISCLCQHIRRHGIEWKHRRVGNYRRAAQ